MATLTVSSTYSAGTAPTEAQIDATRDSLHTFFNTTKMNQDNVAAAGMVYTKLGDAADNAEMKWGTGAEGRMKFDSADNAFEIAGTAASGDVKFTNKATTAEVESLRLKASDRSIRIGTGGWLNIGQGQGHNDYSLAWLISRYRKPRLVYSDNDIFTVEENTGVSGETIVVMKDRVCSVVDRTCSLAATANGYESDDTGAAVSGIEIGVSRTANTWYFAYAVVVQYGSDNSGEKAIIVASDKAPTQANTSTLNTEFGQNKWVYLGAIRNGYNDGTNTNIICRFSYDGYGFCDFTNTIESGLGSGIRVISDTNTTDTTLTIAIGTGATDVPAVASCLRLLWYRAAGGYSAVYEESGGTRMYTSGSQGINTQPKRCDMIVPVISGAVIRHDPDGTGGSDAKRVFFVGFQDQYA